MTDISYPFIEAKHITKIFSDTAVLIDVDFSVCPGEVHALCGENGAGKSTLIKILSGVYERDGGELILNGRSLDHISPKEALNLGIVCVHQELSIVRTLDVAHNLFLGNFPKNKFGLINRHALYHNAKIVLKQIGLDIDPKISCEKLSFAECQLLEIGRALNRNAKLLIFDEPTSALTPKESTVLFSLIKKLKSENVAVIYISHKITELLEISDRITILRDGKVAASTETASLSREELIAFMIGRPLDNFYHKMKVKPREVALSVRNLSKKGVFEDISFEIRRGETVGLFGAVGSGRSSIAESLFGLQKYDSGQIFINGREEEINDVKHAISLGLALVPDDRQINGLSMLMSVLNNIMLSRFASINGLEYLNLSREQDLAEQYIQNISIKTPALNTPVYRLSGGNQQKVVLSKWLMMHPEILILDEPTRGVDIETSAQFYETLSDLASKGAATLLISTDISELLGTCDRILVLLDKHIAYNFNVHDITRDTLIKAIKGED